MKRIAGSMLLLAGLSGCISPSGNTSQGEKKTADAKSSMTVPAPNGFNATPTVPMNTVWSPHPDQRVAARPAPEPMPARMDPAEGMAASRPVPIAPPSPFSVPLAPPPAILQASAALPPSLVPMVTTPPKASGTAPATFPASVPVVALPRTEREQPITMVNATQRIDPLTTSAKVDANSVPRDYPIAAVALPDLAPAAPKKATADARPIKVATPLMRLVNTKRITLNFEVKDIGPSGLANVELWYTQNCRDWKKYDAPTDSKAYVVEVAEEGMYGFTLVARSGLGLAKAPPVSGDQPQVWTIVDLTPPEVQLTEVTPNIDSKQVTIGWKASDKNFSRTPVSVSYAETEAGPWRVVAANLENTGRFIWQMPTGTPPRFIVRVEATDLAGNVTRAQSAKPLLLDNSTPTVSITNVEANVSQ
jgi:hypothetical protein